MAAPDFDLQWFHYLEMQSNIPATKKEFWYRSNATLALILLKSAIDGGSSDSLGTIVKVSTLA